VNADSDSERITRLEAQMQGVERDLRVVFPLVGESAEHRIELKHVADDVRDLQTGVTAAIAEFRHGLDCLKEDAHDAETKRERVRGQREAEERKEKAKAEQDRVDRATTERRDRWARWVPTVAVVAAIVIALMETI